LPNAPRAERPSGTRKSGPVTLDCDVLAVQGGDLRVVVYTAPSGSSEAEALELLGAIGLQSFSG